jgi:hypothetical protein
LYENLLKSSRVEKVWCVCKGQHFQFSGTKQEHDYPVFWSVRSTFAKNKITWCE